MSILLLNGPNLNPLGNARTPHLRCRHVGRCGAPLAAEAVRLGTTAARFQSNHEGHLIDRIHAARLMARGIVINPGGLTHTSVALPQRCAGGRGPAGGGSAHQQRASAKSFATTCISGIADGVIAGLGIQGYEMALHYLVRKLAQAAPDTAGAKSLQDVCANPRESVVVRIGMGHQRRLFGNNAIWRKKQRNRTARTTYPEPQGIMPGHR